MAIPGGWELVRDYDRIKLKKQLRRETPLCYQHPLEIGSMLTIAEAGLEFSSSRVAGPSALPDSLFEAVFDAASLQAPLVVRNFRNGDRFEPFGMSGHKKIKDLFIEKRLPLSVRKHWPLLVCADDILWIPGYGRSRRALVSSSTRTVLRLAARSLES